MKTQVDLMMLKRLIASLLLMTCSVAFAAETPPAVPMKLEILDREGSAFVRLPSHDCSKHGIYKLESSHPRYDQIFDLLMHAQLQGNKVRVHFRGCGDFNKKKKQRYGTIVGISLQ